MQRSSKKILPAGTISQRRTNGGCIQKFLKFVIQLTVLPHIP
jgi:hypothetical protein